MKKSRQIRPITLKEVVGGQQYLVVLLELPAGILHLHHYTICGQPFKREGKLWFRTARRIRGIDPFDDLRWPLFDIEANGLLQHDSHEMSRTFRHTMESKRLLSDIVERQSFDEYAKLINLTDEELFAIFDHIELCEWASNMLSLIPEEEIEREIKSLRPKVH